ncbi:hypothetical protein H4R33_002147 [Dimargaris cristalligena]|uniref:G-protein coupled receptors family 1 profile domain-containing protein n=1 Tax=Dimargaris cristalligena TaxID=215637 RepID=A0A4P9ZU76_9FUNG|nr:hypothetical protein H4R33_002147 [Dimargaris cristalligena]RKP37104.1 hypothetical protein BJ085DRAFT_38630 [Dimargaris cristalligena]|eukprot:RKP37104.1 hypothetical protein BJ085DRAFT_38630 [Dimargaris cristalligena]
MRDQTFHIVYELLTSLSILCSFISIVLILRVRSKKPAAANSPFFSLALWISVADFPVLIDSYFTNPLTFGAHAPSGPQSARFFMWYHMFSHMWVVCLNVMIALDMHLVIFHHLPPKARIRTWYPYIATGMAFFVSFWYLILPGARFKIGSSISVSLDSKMAFQFYISWKCLWLYTAILYVLAVVIAIFFTLYQSRNRINKLILDPECGTRRTALIQNASKVVAYPVMLFVVYLPYAVNTLVVSFQSGPASSALDYLQVLLFTLQGVLNLITLLFHPAMISTYRQEIIPFPGFIYAMMDVKQPKCQSKRKHSGRKPEMATHPLTINSLPSPPPAAVVAPLYDLDLEPNVSGIFNPMEERNSRHTSTIILITFRSNA